jgi:hypothetical protein
MVSRTNSLTFTFSTLWTVFVSIYTWSCRGSRDTESLRRILISESWPSAERRVKRRAPGCQLAMIGLIKLDLKTWWSSQLVTRDASVSVIRPSCMTPTCVSLWVAVGDSLNWWRTQDSHGERDICQTQCGLCHCDKVPLRATLPSLDMRKYNLSGSSLTVVSRY